MSATIRNSKHESNSFNNDAGESRNHNIIVANLTRELTQQLKRRSCELYPGRMRVRIPASRLYTYPDVVIVCGEPEFERNHSDTLLNPKLIIEVLSEFTESYDRGKKFRDYLTIDSFAEYVLVAQDRHRIEQYIKQVDGQWLFLDRLSPEEAIELATIQCMLTMKEVYDKVVFP